MEEKFGEFFQDPVYIKVKNSLFNYRNRLVSIKNVFKKYSEGDKIRSVLDVGSGMSPVSPVPEKTLFVDLSKEGIDILKSWGLNAEVGSINKLKYKKNSFDWIFCSEVLEHIKYYKKSLKEMHRVLKKNGKAIITLPVHMKYWNVDDEFVEHYRRFDPKSFSNELKKAGFDIILEKPIGSIVERKLTLLMVKTFKKTKPKRISAWQSPFLIAINYILYWIVKFSKIFTSKNSTSIMLYLVRKK